HRNVAMTRDQNDRNVQFQLRETLLEIEPAHAGEAHVEHEARRQVRPLRVEEFLRRAMQLRLKVDRAKQGIERVPHRLVVVDDVNQRVHNVLFPRRTMRRGYLPPSLMRWQRGLHGQAVVPCRLFVTIRPLTAVTIRTVATLNDSAQRPVYAVT